MSGPTCPLSDAVWVVRFLPLPPRQAKCDRWKIYAYVCVEKKLWLDERF